MFKPKPIEAAYISISLCLVPHCLMSDILILIGAIKMELKGNDADSVWF